MGKIRSATFAKQLRELADSVEASDLDDSLTCDGRIEAWGKVWKQLFRHNPKFSLVLGKNGIMCAIDEIKRLQLLDRNVSTEGGKGEDGT